MPIFPAEIFHPIFFDQVINAVNPRVFSKYNLLTAFISIPHSLLVPLPRYLFFKLTLYSFKLFTVAKLYDGVDWKEIVCEPHCSE